MAAEMKRKRISCAAEEEKHRLGEQQGDDGASPLCEGERTGILSMTC